MSGMILLYIVLLFVFLVLSAIFSSAETAFISLQRVRLEQMMDAGEPGAKRVSRLLEKPERLLSTILLGNNFVNIAAASLTTLITVTFWGEHWVVISTIVLTAVLLVFCETTPKTMATHHASRLSLAYARPIETLSVVLTPFVLALSSIASRISRTFGGEPVPRALVGEDEIRTMISVGHKEGTVEEEEAEMLHNVFDFGNRAVREAIIPRTDVIWVEQGTVLSDFLGIYAEAPLSRFPVYAENMDNVIGILAVKDVLMALAKGTISNEDVIDDLIRPAYFAPETKRINELFTEMRDKNYHMTVIVDEYGGTAGIVSLSRLVEEIVGPVGDEFAEAEKDYEAINEYTFQIDGGMRIEEVNEELGLELPEGDYETVAGFILDLLGHIPKFNQTVRYRGLKLVVTEMKGLKIEKILLTKRKNATSTD